MGPILNFYYTNHRGEFAHRAVIPMRLSFMATEWHKEPQWVLEAYDINKTQMRYFALKDCDFTKAGN
jgi:predicted DNA-binding transcriptional regulator YafY